MKFAIYLVLMGALALGPAACTRNNAPDESVSANADRTDRSNQTAPAETAKDATNERTAERPRETVRETRPAAPAPEKEISRNEPKAPALKEDRPVARRTETVPSGTTITATLADAISSDMSKQGDKFTAHLTQPVVINGKVVADKGAVVTGHVADVDDAGRVKGRAKIELVLDEIRTGKESHKLSTEPFVAVAEDTHTRDAAEIAGGAAVGAAIGAVAGGKKGAAIGAIIGGGTGTTAVLATKGKDLRLESETKVNFVLSRDVELPVIRSANT